MNSITMITDMLRKRFGAEPQTGTTLIPLTMQGSDYATPPFWTECWTAVSNKLHSGHLAEISWKAEYAHCFALLYNNIFYGFIFQGSVE